MRRPRFQMTPESARAFLAQAPVVHMATTDREGRPILRTVHGILTGDAVAFHGAPVGEKQEAIGRPAVLGAEEIVASVPSYFTDPERACPATTLYRSVQAHGTIEPVTDPQAKARILQLLMGQYQPEGGHVPITADHPLYAKAVAGIQVLQVPIAHMDGKAKLGQNLRPEAVSRVVTRLWQRGGAGDARAVDLIRQANPTMPLPAFLQAPEGMVLRCHLAPGEVRVAVAAWAEAGRITGDLADALGIPGAVWVGAEGRDGRLTACMAGASDGHAVRILAGAVADDPGDRAVLDRLTGLLLEHPALRHAQKEPMTPSATPVACEVMP